MMKSEKTAETNSRKMYLILFIAFFFKYIKKYLSNLTNYQHVLLHGRAKITMAQEIVNKCNKEVIKGDNRGKVRIVFA